ncbi:MAG: class I SAM-dependent methyltransferase [Thermoproteota archaeon]
MVRLKIHVCSGESESWDTIWKWLWFTREVWETEYWKEEKKALKPILTLLSRLRVKSVLDCSCGLGYKTVLFAKAGYEAEGSDASATAIKHAPKLAKDEGVSIRFFRSRYEELGRKCKRKYDCVWSDNFDEINTYGCLKTSARSIYSVLNPGGKLVFTAPPGGDLEKTIEKEWKRRKRFNAYLPSMKGSVRVTRVEIAEKTPEGILEHNVFLVEKGEFLRVEIASIMNPRIKWTSRDFKKVLKEVGFKQVYVVKEGCILAVK